MTADLERIKEARRMLAAAGCGPGPLAVLDNLIASYPSWAAVIAAIRGEEAKRGDQ